jgi:integrase
LTLKKPKPADPVAFTLDEVEAIFGKAHKRYKPIFELLAFTGMRIGELEWLTWDDIDFEKGFVEIRAKDRWQPKDGDDRSIPMHPRVRRLLEGLPRAGRWVFVGPPCAKYPEGGQRVAERRALAALKKAAMKAGVPEKKRKLYTFRHFFASFCANSVPDERCPLLRTVLARDEIRVDLDGPTAFDRSCPALTGVCTQDRDVPSAPQAMMLAEDSCLSRGTG